MDCIYAEGYVQDLLSHLKIIFHNRIMQGLGLIKSLIKLLKFLHADKFQK